LGAGHALQMGSYFEPATQARIFGPTGQFVAPLSFPGREAKPACVAVPQLVVDSVWIPTEFVPPLEKFGPTALALIVTGHRSPAGFDDLPQFGCIHVDTTNSRLASRVTKDGTPHREEDR